VAGALAAVRNCAARDRHDRGSSGMRIAILAAIATVLALCAAAPAAAQLNPLDVETLRSVAQTRAPTDDPSVNAPAPAPATLPPPAADAAELLGANAAADEPPMFGQQLFRGAVQ